MAYCEVESGALQEKNQPKPPRRRGVWTPRLQEQLACGKLRGMKRINRQDLQDFSGSTNPILNIL